MMTRGQLSAVLLLHGWEARMGVTLRGDRLPMLFELARKNYNDRGDWCCRVVWFEESEMRCVMRWDGLFKACRPCTFEAFSYPQLRRIVEEVVQR